MGTGADPSNIRDRMQGEFRRDIQGLRALAVGLVIVSHATGWPTGGFVGVDVFFVISGFLITGIMIREISESGSLSLRGFYARRVRRILPAETVTLAVTVGLAFAIWFPPRALQTLLDAFWSATFMANWHFQSIGSDYFASGAPTSPVLHYWSLAIEEQFYALWPVVVAVASLRGSVRRNLGVIAGSVAALSLFLGWQSMDDGAATHYFDSALRCWELLAGALLAIVGAASPNTSIRVRRVVFGFGLALIVGSALVVQETWPLPFPWVAPAVIGAVAVLWANVPQSLRSVLGNPLAQRVGDDSYSLYLWHFPVIVFLESTYGNGGLVAFIAIGLTALISRGSRKFVEVRFLRTKLLSRAAGVRNPSAWVPRDFAVGVIALVTLSALVAIYTSAPESLTDAKTLARRLGTGAAKPGSLAATSLERSALVAAGLRSEAWPSRMNSLEAFGLGVQDAGCLNTVFVTGAPRICGKREPGGALLIGDSVALSWQPGVKRAADELGIGLTWIGYAGCSIAPGVRFTHPDFGPRFPSACAAKQREAIEIARQLKPKYVIVSGQEAALRRTGLPAEQAEEVWRRGTRQMLRGLAVVPKVFVLSDPPSSPTQPNCLNRLTSPKRCSIANSVWQAAKARAERSATAEVGNARYVDTRAWFCSDGRCPAVVGGDLVSGDGIHLTTASAKSVANLIKRTLFETD